MYCVVYWQGFEAKCPTGYVAYIQENNSGSDVHLIKVVHFRATGAKGIPHGDLKSCYRLLVFLQHVENYFISQSDRQNVDCFDYFGYIIIGGLSNYLLFNSLTNLYFIIFQEKLFPVQTFPASLPIAK